MIYMFTLVSLSACPSVCLSGTAAAAATATATATAVIIVLAFFTLPMSDTPNVHMRANGR